MRVIKCKNYEEVSSVAAHFVASQVMLKPNSNIGLPTGSTPIGMYKKLSEMNLDFSKIKTFNLDEYYPIKRDNDQSYWYFMNDNLYSKVNLDPKNTFIPNGEAEDAEKECENYEKLIEEKGGLDLQVVGIGQNGHVGFNEPDAVFIADTHKVKLTQNTLEVNSQYFNDISEMPTEALTMGVGTIMKAKRILFIAAGKEKARVVKALFNGKIDPQIPATILCAHPDVTIVVDESALA